MTMLARHIFTDEEESRKERQMRRMLRGKGRHFNEIGTKTWLLNLGSMNLQRFQGRVSRYP